MSHNNYHRTSGVPLLHLLLSTGMGSGFCPLAPGTTGALVALGAWYVLYLQLSTLWLTLATAALIVVTTAVGVWTSGVMERYWGKDPRAVNIDEFVGTWIPLLAAPCGDKTWLLALFGFAMFRVIDIFKPLGCRYVDERCPGGWGVMLDDVLAGTYALVLTYLLRLTII